MEKVVLVTGGAGYIGSHTVVALYANGFTPIIIDDFRNSKVWILDRLKEITGKSIIHYAVDCCDEEKVLTILKKYPEALGVIHFAADKAVGESVDKPIQYYQNNVGSICNMISCMEKVGIKNFVFSSSCTVYGDADNPVVTEKSPVKKATSPYADTKVTCEKIVQFQNEANDSFNPILLRYFNPIGAHSSSLIGELPQGIPNNLLPYITQTAKGIREKLVVFGDDYNTPDGTNIRDYIHVMDLANAHVKALNYLIENEEGKCEIVNLGTGKGSSVLDIIRTFESINNLKLNYEIGERRVGDVEQIYANAEKAESLLGWKCEYSLEEALKDAWEWEKGVG